jgi:hypothetical protein
MQHLTADTNLVYYDWEITAPRSEACLFISQILRAGLGLPQLPMDSACVVWLKNVRTRLGNSWTQVTCPNPNQLVFDRQSTVGLTGVEIQLLTDWLESPQFPGSFYSFQGMPTR